MKTPPKNLMVILCGLFLMVQSLCSQEKRYFPEFRIEGGLFASSKDYDQNPSTGEIKFYSVPEAGFETGITCRIARYHFVSIWGDAGFFGPSMVVLSQVQVGTTFLYGDLTTGFACGPTIALGSLGKMIGGQVCFKKFYIKCLVGSEKGKNSELLLHAYSVSSGYSFAVWPGAK